MTNQSGIKAFLALCLSYILEDQNMSPLKGIDVNYNPNSDLIGVHLEFEDGTMKDCNICIPGIVTSVNPVQFSQHTTQIVEELKNIIFDKQFTDELESILEVVDET